MEHKEINRGWVKNAAIIFLAVLLVLTFFSNTIMNRTLPEVATQSVTSGSITARVRGTGTVVANGSYTVAVTLEGGTGKATVTSPAKLKSENGQMTATIVWSRSADAEML